jgi:hypothetical protein
MTDAEYIGELAEAGARSASVLHADLAMVSIYTPDVMGRLHRYTYTEAEAVRVAALLTQGAAELRKRREAQGDERTTTTRSSI